MPRDLRPTADTARMDISVEDLPRYPVGSVWLNETSLACDYLQVTAARQDGEFAWIEMVGVVEVDGERDWRKVTPLRGSLLK